MTDGIPPVRRTLLDVFVLREICSVLPEKSTKGYSVPGKQGGLASSRSVIGGDYMNFHGLIVIAVSDRDLEVRNHGLCKSQIFDFHKRAFVKFGVIGNHNGLLGMLPGDDNGVMSRRIGQGISIRDIDGIDGKNSLSKNRLFKSR